MANSFSSAIISASSHNPVSHTVCNYIYVSFPVSCAKNKVCAIGFRNGGKRAKKDNGGEGEKGPDKKGVVAKYSCRSRAIILVILQNSLSKKLFPTFFLSSSFSFLYSESRSVSPFFSLKKLIRLNLPK